MKNKKGFTMVELMFSVVIIAIVMAFLVQLLIDINYDKTNELYDTANNFNRAEIIKTIESDFIIDKVKSFNVGTSTVALKNDKGTGTITVDSTNGYISYEFKNTYGTQITYKKWKLEKNNNETHIYSNIISSCKYTKDVANNKNNYYLTINIPIIINYSKDPKTIEGNLVFIDSKMDDISLSFYNTAEITGTGTGVCGLYA